MFCTGEVAPSDRRLPSHGVLGGCGMGSSGLRLGMIGPPSWGTPVGHAIVVRARGGIKRPGGLLTGRQVRGTLHAREERIVTDPASPIPDPVAAWRSWISQSEQQWNALLNQAMGSD